MYKKTELKEFGYIWSFIFIVMSIYYLYINSISFSILFFVVSFVFILISLNKPKLLSLFYKYWIKLGEVIGNIISKVIMFVLYFTLFTFFSILLKLLGKDLLNKKINKTSSTYWKDRNNQPESMKNQF